MVCVAAVLGRCLCGGGSWMVFVMVLGGGREGWKKKKGVSLVAVPERYLCGCGSRMRKKKAGVCFVVLGWGKGGKGEGNEENDRGKGGGRLIILTFAVFLRQLPS